ncbi:hypothetical protein [Agromyces sp. NPDC058104]|uniref:hypothetical protein n=1 Tax=Agromyces sp. NPDC058104 TaxID=3346342 RepID=UPI0036D9CC15
MSTPATISGAWLDVVPEVGGVAVLAALAILSAYAVDSIKKARPRPRYRRRSGGTR